MKNKEALSYIIKKAKKFGYTDCQIAAFAYEVQEKIAEMPETDEEQLDELFEMWFQFMTEKSIDKIKTTLVPYEVYTEYDYVDCAAFYIKTALGDRLYIHTNDRSLAQAVADEYSGVKSKYKVVPAKISKTKSKREDGGYSAVGSSTRKCYVKKN